MNEKKEDVGVIVGRFQTPYLHEAHRDLIDSVLKNHAKVILFLGLSPVLGTINNPLDFEARKKMIQQLYPQISILYIKDSASDHVWSKKLDEMISDVVSPGQSVVLYGSRDSFISRYYGRFKTSELESKIYVSASEIRNSISKSVKESPDFRAGVIWAAYNRYPTAYTTVDIAIFNYNNPQKMILLGRKPDEQKYRLIGGFSSPDSLTFEEDAIREVYEEASIEIGDIKYNCSHIIDDYRYRGERDKIKTILFTAKYVFGSPKAGDDISEIRWFDVDKIRLSDIVDGHHILMEALESSGLIKIIR